MTRIEIDQCIVSLADELQEKRDQINDGLSKDAGGLVQKALQTIDYAVTVLSRLSFRIADDEIGERE